MGNSRNLLLLGLYVRRLSSAWLRGLVLEGIVLSKPRRRFWADLRLASPPSHAPPAFDQQTLVRRYGTDKLMSSLSSRVPALDRFAEG